MIEEGSCSNQESQEDTIVAKAIGRIGRWQLEKTIILALCFTPLAWHFMAYPLISRGSDYWCLSPFSDDESDFSEDQCFLESYNNDTIEEVPCQSWEFDHRSTTTIQEDFQLVCQFEHFLALRQIIFFSGMLLGCLTTGYLSDLLGRKTTMLALMGVWSLTSILHIFVYDFRLFLVLQFILAFTCNSAWTTSWIWTMEVVNGKWRTILGCGTFLFWGVGYITLPGIVWLFPNWRHAWAAMSLPTVLFAAYYYIIPESPLWLICNSREEEAKAILRDAAKRNGMEPMTKAQWNKIMEASALGSQSDVSSSSGFTSLVKTPNLRKRSLILFISWFVCSLTYYGLSLNSNGIGEDPFLTFTFFGAIEIPAILVSVVSLLTAGRRLPLIFLLFGSGICCTCAAVVPVGIFHGNWPTVLLAIGGKFCITCCFHILFVYSSEIYATTARNTGVGCCSVFARAGGMVAPLVEQLKTVNPYLPIAVFGLSACFAALLSSFMPETKGRKLPETVEESEEFGSDDTLWSSIFQSSRQNSFVSCQSESQVESTSTASKTQKPKSPETSSRKSAYFHFD